MTKNKPHVILNEGKPFWRARSINPVLMAAFLICSNKPQTPKPRKETN